MVDADNLPMIDSDEEPDVVLEARGVLRRLRLIGAVGLLGLVFICVSLVLLVGLSSFVLLPILFWGFIAFAAYELYPLGGDASWARRVLKRWDEARVDRAFDQIGAASDPRLESAGAMAGRIVADPAADPHTKSVVGLVTQRLRSALDDLRMLDLAEQADGPHRRARPDPELRTLLDARIAGLMGALSDVYRACLARDEARVRELVGNLEDLTHRLEAEAEIETFLEPGPDA